MPIAALINRQLLLPTASQIHSEGTRKREHNSLKNRSLAYLALRSISTPSTPSSFPHAADWQPRIPEHPRARWTFVNLDVREFIHPKSKCSKKNAGKKKLPRCFKTLFKTLLSPSHPPLLLYNLLPVSFHNISFDWLSHDDAGKINIRPYSKTNLCFYLSIIS